MEEVNAPKIKIPLWAASLVVVGIALFTAVRMHQQGGYFDDAFMFYRYAMNFRHGLGWAWNLDGVHTYGMTSLTWQFVVLLFSFLPCSPFVCLSLASLITYLVATAYLTYFLSSRAESKSFADPGFTLTCVSLPLLLQLVFRFSYVNGMETMLGFLFSAMLACLSLDLRSRPSPRLAIITGIVAYLSMATRPESALCAIGVPTLVLLFASSPRRLALAAIHVGTAGALVLAQLLAAKQYFDTPLPLSFYLKTRNAYEGFIGYRGSASAIAFTISYLLIYLLALILFTNRHNVPLVNAFLLPTALTMAYLSTVIQIMGYSGRYYIPYLPYVIVVAWVVTDQALAAKPRRAPGWGQIGAAAALIALTSWSNFTSLIAVSEAKYVAAHGPLPLPRLLPETVSPLPTLPLGKSLDAFVREVAKGMTRDSWLAASEVGYLGVAAPQVNIFDLAGLNSRDQTFSKFNPDVLFRLNPDVIWMPHTDYTGLDGTLLRDSRLTGRYDLIAGAYDYGVAVRKNSPQHDAILQRIAHSWQQHYPGTRMTDYIVHTP